MFRRDGSSGEAAYYVLFSPLCCYCHTGSPTAAYVAPHPLGPYTPAGDLGNAPGAQGNFVFVHPDVPGTVLWSGNRWGSASDGLFDHALQYWAPLSFTPSGFIQPLLWQDAFDLRVCTNATGAPRAAAV